MTKYQWLFLLHILEAIIILILGYRKMAEKAWEEFGKSILVEITKEHDRTIKE